MARYKIVRKSQKISKKRKVKVTVFAVICCLIALTLVFGVTLYRWFVTPTLLDIAKSRVRSQATLAINEAVCSALASCDGSQFVTVECCNGKVQQIYANSIVVNDLARKTAILAQNKLEELASTVIEIPIGTLSGIPFLSELGSSVNVTVSPISAVSCSFSSQFESVGINQTLHRIYVNVSCLVDLIVPTMSVTMDCSTPVLVCENLIIGEVPQTYLNGFYLGGS